LQDVLTQLVQFVEEAAPEVWRIAMKQVMIQAWQYAIVIAVCSALAYVLAKVAKHQNELHEENYRGLHDMGAIFGVVGSAISAGIAFGFAVSIVGLLANPEYYAIRLLLYHAQ